MLYAAGILGGLLGMLHLGKREGLDADLLWEAALVLIGSIVLGARLEYVRTKWAYFAEHPARILALRDGGLVFYGGFVGVLVGVALWTWWRRAPGWKLLDLMSVMLPFGHAIGRVGCVLAGCCYGAPTSMPWGLVYPAGSDAPAGVPLHPTQLYEAAFGVALGTVLWRMRAGRRFDGQVFATFLLAYPLFRSANELLRGDAVRGFVGGVSNGQLISLGLFALGLTVWWARSRTARSAPGS